MRDRTGRCGAVESPLDSKPSSNIPFDKLPGVGAIVRRIENENSGQLVKGGLRRLIESSVLAWALSLCAIGGLLLLPFKLRTRWNQLDFSAFYVWAVALHRGLNPYSDRLDSIAKNLGMNLGPYDLANYPPLFLICFLPLTHLSAPAAYVVWMSLQYLLLAGVIYLLVGSDHTLSLATRASIASLLVLFFPLYDNFCYAQVQLMMLFGLLAVQRLLARRADAMAGLLLSFLALLKLYPVVLVGYLLVRRRWRAIAWVALGIIAGTACTWLAFGGRILMVIPSASGLTGAPVVTHSLAGGIKALSNIPSVLTQQRGFLSLSDQVVRLVRRLDPGASNQLTTLAIMLGLGLALVLAVYATLRSNPDWHNDIAVFSLWVALTPLITHAYEDYGVLLLMPLALIAGSVARGEKFFASAKWLALAAYALANATPVAIGALHFPQPPILAVFKELLTIGFVAAWFYALSIGLQAAAANPR
jgi:hypothetical protein